jgi:hypothetical protein
VNSFLRILSCLALVLPGAALADGSPTAVPSNSARSKVAQDVKEAADAAAPTVGTVNKGQIVIPVGTQGPWSKVDFYQDKKFKSGFVPTDSIDLGATAAAPGPAPAPAKTAAPAAPARPAAAPTRTASVRRRCGRPVRGDWRAFRRHSAAALY